MDIGRRAEQLQALDCGGGARHLDPWRKGSYLGTIVGAVLLGTMTALIPGVNASKGWRSVILGGLILAMLPLSGSDQSR